MPKSDQGVDKKRYFVIPRTLIFIFNQGKVLLIRGNKNKNLWAEKYNGLGGHVEAGEDIDSAAYRELWEESGQKAIDLQQCGTVMCDVEPQMGVAISVFRGDYSGEVLKESVEGALVWVELDRLEEINVVEDLRVLVPRAFRWRSGKRLFSALNSYNENDELITRFHDEE